MERCVTNAFPGQAPPQAPYYHNNNNNNYKPHHQIHHHVAAVGFHQYRQNDNRDQGFNQPQFFNHYRAQQQQQQQQQSMIVDGSGSSLRKRRCLSSSTPAPGDAALQSRRTGVWWDLNTCPVPAGFDPRRVRGCIESALEKQMGGRSEVHIYAMGNLEYISSDLLEGISSSGIMLIHAPCGGNDLFSFLLEWAEHSPPPANVMLISYDNSMVTPHLFHPPVEYTCFCAYPQDHPPVTVDDPEYHKVFVKEFVWETLLNDNMCDQEVFVNEDEPLCICDICHDTFEICAEFITHLKSEEHREELFDNVPRDSKDKPIHFCQVCNYPAYDKYNLLLHNESEEHHRKLAEKKAQEEDCESRKKQSL